METTGRVALGRQSARGAAAFCIALAVFQAALALGAPLGDMAWGGADKMLPPAMRWASLGAGIYLLLAAAALLARAGDWGQRLPQGVFWASNIFLVLQLALNTAGNLASSSPAERAVMAPASALGFVLCLGAIIFLPRRAVD